MLLFYTTVSSFFDTLLVWITKITLAILSICVFDVDSHTPVVSWISFHTSTLKRSKVHKGHTTLIYSKTTSSQKKTLNVQCVPSRTNVTSSSNTNTLYKYSVLIRTFSHTFYDTFPTEKNRYSGTFRHTTTHIYICPSKMNSDNVVVSTISQKFSVQIFNRFDLDLNNKFQSFRYFNPVPLSKYHALKL